jgi:hypothetical protein
MAPGSITNMVPMQASVKALLPLPIAQSVHTKNPPGADEGRSQEEEGGGRERVLRSAGLEFRGRLADELHDAIEAGRRGQESRGPAPAGPALQQREDEGEEEPGRGRHDEQ